MANYFKKVSLDNYEIGLRLSFPEVSKIFLRYGLVNIYNELKLPKRATKGSAGYDFFAPFDIEIKAGETVKFPTGYRVHLDDDKFLMIVPRSGLGFKYRCQLDNTVGIIDSDYYYSDNEGEMWIKLTNDSREGKTIHIPKGTAYAQGIILSFFKTDDDFSDGIRNGGFGSSTK